MPGSESKLSFYLRETNLKCSIDELKKKKESLMATFRNCKMKLKNSEKSGAGLSDLYTPNWFAFPKMSKFVMSRDCPKKNNKFGECSIS